MYDVVIIGAGVVGCAIARELSRFQLKIAVLEKEADVGWGASCRNSGVVHSGYNNRPGTLMAKFCVEGNRGFEQLCTELDVAFRRVGKLVVADKPEEMEALERLKAQGEENGVQDLEIIDGDRVRELEPHLRNAFAAILSPNSAITSPYQLTIALAENSLSNGVDFFLNNSVTDIRKTRGKRGKPFFQVGTGKEKYEGRILINSSGIHSAEISNLAGVKGYRIYPCRGEYHVLDKYAGELIERLIYPVPKPGTGGLGIHLTPTIDGNILIGPSNEYVVARSLLHSEKPVPSSPELMEDFIVTDPVMRTLSKEARDYMPQFDGGYHIRSYSGMRAKQSPPEVGGFFDYIIKEEDSCPGLVNLIGIESPGLTASLPIARYVKGLVEGIFRRAGNPPGDNKAFNPLRKGVLRFSEQDEKTRARMIAEDPDYGEVVCRCETVTKKEVLQAIDNPLGARSLISIKYRSRAMMGRCQGGYCAQRILQILIDEYGYRPGEIELGKPGSYILTGGRCDLNGEIQGETYI